MKNRNRYALLTVDTEALPHRAPHDHVNRLILGKHGENSAGVREMSAIADEFGAKHIFFVDFCAPFESELEKTKEIAIWLDAHGQDVQLHTHPEMLSESFFKSINLQKRPRFMNLYNKEKNLKIIEYFSKLLEETLNKPVLAHRAGSFRWNANTLRALKVCNIPLSFNNSYKNYVTERNPYSIKSFSPFYWNNGLIEIPVTEKQIFPFYKDNLWTSLQFPPTKYFKYRSKLTSWIPYSVDKSSPFLVSLIHSWSLLDEDENKYFIYKNDKKAEEYRKFVKMLAKDYDIITSPELLDLVKSGKLIISHTEQIKHAEYIDKNKTALQEKLRNKELLLEKKTENLNRKAENLKQREENIKLRVERLNKREEAIKIKETQLQSLEKKLLIKE